MNNYNECLSRFPFTDCVGVHHTKLQVFISNIFFEHDNIGFVNANNVVAIIRY